jgi:hypothetical protein
VQLPFLAAVLLSGSLFPAQAQQPPNLDWLDIRAAYCVGVKRQAMDEASQNIAEFQRQIAGLNTSTVSKQERERSASTMRDSIELNRRTHEEARQSAQRMLRYTLTRRQSGVPFFNRGPFVQVSESGKADQRHCNAVRGRLFESACFAACVARGADALLDCVGACPENAAVDQACEKPAACDNLETQLPM